MSKKFTLIFLVLPTVIVSFLGLMPYLSSNYHLQTKIEIIADLDQAESEKFQQLVLNNSYQRGRLKEADKLLIDNQSPNFCSKSAQDAMTGRYIYPKLGSFYISFIKTDGEWEVCTGGTAP